MADFDFLVYSPSTGAFKAARDFAFFNPGARLNGDVTSIAEYRISVPDDANGLIDNAELGATNVTSLVNGDVEGPITAVAFHLLVDPDKPEIEPIRIAVLSRGNESSPVANSVVIRLDENNNPVNATAFPPGAKFEVKNWEDAPASLNLDTNVTPPPTEVDPDAVDDAFSVGEDGSVTFDVVANDVEGNEGPITILSIEDPANGTAVDAGNGQITYTPDADFNGTETFTYTVTDGSGGTDTATITVTVNAVNDAPLTADSSDTTDEDLTLNGQLLASDVDGDTPEFALGTDAANGSVTVNPDGSYSYAPNADFNGTDSFTYTVSDGNGGEATGTVTVDVAAVNDAPETADSSDATDEDTTLNGQLLASDVDGDTPVFALGTDAANGSVTVNPDGSYSYAPDADFNGSDSFTYTVSDGNGGTATGTVTVDVAAVNDAPETTDSAAATDEDTTLNGQLLASDVDGDTPVFALGTDAANGSVTVNPDGSYSYAPDADFNGSDSFTYTVSDGNGGTATGTVTVDVAAVNDAPETTDSAAATDEDTTLNGQLLASDVDGDTPVFALGTDAANGSVTVNPDGSYSYAPDADFNGSDSFTYTVSDGNGGTATGTVTVDVAAVNDAPETTDSAAATDEDTTLNGQLLASDVDGDTPVFALGTDAANGSVTVNPDGSYSYAPDADFNGSDSFTYTVSDGNGGEATGTVTVDVAAVNDAPETTDSAAATDEDTTLNGQLLASDVDGDTPEFALGTDAANGTVTVNSDGSYSYAPDADFNGSDSFTYTVSDGNGGTATGTVTVDVAAVNDAPETTDSAAATDEDTTLNGQLLASDVDGDTPEFALGTNAANGTVTVNPDGSYSYAPNADFNGTDSFTYTVSDGNGGEATGTVTVDVAAVNDAPETTDSAAATDEDTTLNGQLLASDVDGDTPEFALGTNAANGSVTVNPDGSYSYAPDADFNGSDSFTYTVSDGNGGEATGTVTVDVAAVNDAPVAVADSEVTPFETETIIDVLANDSDVDDGDVVSIAIVGDPDNGEAVIEGGKVLYTPDEGFSGQDTFTYSITDGVETVESTITVTVESPDNTAPVAQDGAITLDEDSLNVGQLLFSDGETANADLTVEIVDDVDNGVLVLGAAGQFTYTPDLDFNGSDSFTYRVSDGELTSSVQTISITVDPVNDLPVFTPVSATASEDDAVIGINLLDGASDIDGDDLDVTNVIVSSNDVVLSDTTVDEETGQVTLGASQFQGLGAGESAEVTISYLIADGTEQLPNTATLTVEGVNDDPVAVADTDTVEQGQSVTIDLVGNDTDVDGDTLTLGEVGSVSPSVGTIDTSSGQLVFTAAADFVGDAVIAYEVLDGKGGSNTGQVTISVSEKPNEAPVATEDSFDIGEAGSVTGNLIRGEGGATEDSDPDGDTLTVTEVRDADGNVLNLTNENELASGGNLAVGTDGAISFDTVGDFDDLVAGETATVSFTYTISDGELTSTAGVTITIEGADTPNTTPVAGDFAVSTDEDQTVVVNFADNISDVDGDTLTVAPQDGVSGSVDFVDGAFVYTPDADFNGEDSFTYSVSDSNGGEATGQVTVTVAAVNDAPETEGATETTNEDETLSGTLLATDVDDGDILTFALVTDGDNGSVTVNSNGTYSYVPDVDFNGTDSFTYSVSDGEETIEGTVNVTVAPVNDNPVAGNDSFTVQSGQLLTVTAAQILINDSDIDGDGLSLADNTDVPTGEGAIQSFDTGGFTYDPGAFLGTTSFDYEVSDGNGGSDTATITLTVTDAPNTDPTAANGTASVDEDGSVAIDLAELADDDDGDTLTITPGSAANGTFEEVNGEFIYTPNADFNGEEVLGYTVSDGNGGSASGEVTVTVNAVNDAPVTVDSSGTTDEDLSLNGQLLASDVDGDTLAFSLDTDATNGTVMVSPDGSYSYAPDADFNGTDSFTYKVADGNGGEASGTVTVNVAAVNDAPTAADDEDSTDADTSVTVNVLGNDRDVDSSDLSVSLVPGTLQGTADVNADGSITYDPNGAFATLALGLTETVSFDYVVSDGELEDTATVLIEVTGTFEAPPALNDVIGTAGIDRLRGTEGADRIDGQGGRLDTLTGLGGADVFDFTASSTNGARERQIVTDFEAGVDKLDLGGAVIVSTASSGSRTFLNLDGDMDQIILMGVSSFDTDFLV